MLRFGEAWVKLIATHVFGPGGGSMKSRLILVVLLACSSAPAILAQSTPSPALLALAKRDKTLAIVDPATLKVVAKIPAGNDPHEVIASADGKFAYISNYGGGAYNTISVADLVAQIRQRWPKVAIVLRADSGFGREALMAWCEANRVDYVFGLARNPRLEAILAAPLAQAARRVAESGKPARLYCEFRHRTLDSWSRDRRVVGKAEQTLQGANPRFIVTSLCRRRHDARALYEELYCARGEAENRIGEQFELFADRASSATMQANQLRLWFSAMAYVLLDTLRRIGLRHTQFADAAITTIRLKLLKLGAQVRISVRRIHFALAGGCPNRAEFAMAHLYLKRAFNTA